jgi:hypothetical protein
MAKYYDDHHYLAIVSFTEARNEDEHLILWFVLCDLNLVHAFLFLTLIEELCMIMFRLLFYVFYVGELLLI